MSLENDLEIWMSDKEDRKRKTYLEDFLEKYPNAPKDICGTPKMCPEDLYPNAEFEECVSYEERCFKCWNRKIEVNKQWMLLNL